MRGSKSLEYRIFLGSLFFLLFLIFAHSKVEGQGIITHYNLITNSSSYGRGETVSTLNNITITWGGGWFEGRTIKITVTNNYTFQGKSFNVSNCSITYHIEESSGSAIVQCNTTYTIPTDISQQLAGIWNVTGNASVSDIPMWYEENFTTFEVKVKCGNNLCEYADGEFVTDCAQDCCEPNCTAVNDSICHQECDGWKGCEFKSLCDNSPINSIKCYNDTHSLSCCTGEPTYCGNGYLCCNNSCVLVSPDNLSPPQCFNDSMCDDNDACTIDSCVNPGTCESECNHTRITQCSFNDSDGCCPAGCNYTTDIDCPMYCGDGYCNISIGESDPASDNFCPADCCTAQCTLVSNPDVCVYQCSGSVQNPTGNCSFEVPRQCNFLSVGTRICIDDTYYMTCCTGDIGYCGEGYVCREGDCVANITNVTIAEITTTFLSPSEGEVFNRGMEVLVKIKGMVDSSPLLGAQMKARVNFSKSLEIDLFDDGKHEDGDANDGIYANSFKISGEVSDGIYEVKITGTYKGQDFSSSISIYVNSSLALEVEEIGDSYVRGSEIPLRGSVKDVKGNGVANANVSIRFEAEGLNLTEVTTTNENGDFNCPFLISFADPLGDWKILIRVVDSFNNSAFLQLSTRVKASREAEFFGVTFYSPPGGFEYRRGDNVTISVSVTFKNQPLTGAKVNFRDPRGNLIELQETSPGVYTYVYHISMVDPIGDWRIGVAASKIIDGKYMGGGNFVVVKILPLELNVKVIAPTTFEYKTGDTITLKVMVTYSNGEPVSGALIKAITPSKKEIGFVEREPGVYEAVYQVSEEDVGVLSLKISAEDKYGNLGEHDVGFVITKAINPVEKLKSLIPIIIIFIPMILISAAYYKRRKRFSTIKKLEAERERLIAMRDAAERRYFDRAIDEETYEKLMREYEKKLVDIETKLKFLKKEEKKEEK